MDSDIVDSANPLEDGRDLALAPENSASLWISGNVTRRLTVGGGAQYMDAIFRNTTTDLRVPSYWLTNTTIAYELNSHLTLRMNATNLGDRRYVDRVGGGHYVPGPGRAVQITTSVGF
jgi:catecholate siderophore receptor